MELFGINISFSKNGQYVKHKDCYEKHQDIKILIDQRIEDLKSHISNRFDDYKDFFLKNGR